MPLTAQLGNDDGRLSAYNVCVESNKRLSANTSVSGNSTHTHTHNSLREIHLFAYSLLAECGQYSTTFSRSSANRSVDYTHTHTQISYNDIHMYKIQEKHMYVCT